MTTIPAMMPVSVPSATTPAARPFPARIAPGARGDPDPQPAKDHTISHTAGWAGPCRPDLPDSVIAAATEQGCGTATAMLITRRAGQVPD